MCNGAQFAEKKFVVQAPLELKERLQRHDADAAAVKEWEQWVAITKGEVDTTS